MDHRRTIIVGETHDPTGTHSFDHYNHEFEVLLSDSVGLSITPPSKIIPTPRHSWYQHFVPAEGFNDEIISNLYKACRIWSSACDGRGTLAQMAVYAEVCEENRGRTTDVLRVEQLLSERNLMEDQGHVYGSCRYVIEPPQELILWLFSLPGAGHSVEDVRHIFFEFDDDIDAFGKILSPEVI